MDYEDDEGNIRLREWRQNFSQMSLLRAQRRRPDHAVLQARPDLDNEST